MRLLKSFIHALGRRYCRELCNHVSPAFTEMAALFATELCRREFAAQSFHRINERPIEYTFALSKLIETMPKTVLDVGTGTTALPHLIRNCGFLVTATDNVVDYWPEGMFNRHYTVLNDDIRNTRLKERFDFICCISTLEHIDDWESAARCMRGLLNPGGHLVLTFPFNEQKYVQNVYDLPGATYGQASPYVCQVYSRNEVNRMLPVSEGTIVAQEYWRFWEGALWTLGSQVTPPKRVESSDLHQLTCILYRKNAA